MWRTPLCITVCVWLFLLTTTVHSIETAFQETAGINGQLVAEFELDPDFYVGKCDPCIPRAEYTIQVIVHGTANDVYWQQVRLAMEQASRDTGVALDFELYKDGSSSEEISAWMAQKIRLATQQRPEDRPEAMIVTLPSAAVHQAVAHAIQERIPVFGFHSGHEFTEILGLLGFVAQDETLAGRLVAKHLMTLLEERQAIENATETIQDNPPKILFINHEIEDDTIMARYRGLRLELLEASSGSIQATQLVVDPDQVFDTVQTLNDQVFLDCPYDAVVLGGKPLVDIAVSAMTDLGCAGKMILTSFGMNEAIHSAIVEERIAFTAAPQHYIEAAFAVVMASMFVTTGKKLSLPQDYSKIYLSGPVLVTLDNIPSDSTETCREQAFSVCDADGRPYHEVITSNTENSASCNGFGCLPRKSIRIGGVLHGSRTDSFWDPVFAAAYQAAADVGITLELERFEAHFSELLFEKMAARIASLCESGVDGIFVTIPSEQVLNSIRLCQRLKIPVISVNAGADLSQEMGLLQHVGQMEYNAGYGAGVRLGEEGIKEAYCLNHQIGNIVLDERCNGFGDALAAEYPGVSYRGVIAVPDDIQTLYRQAVESKVAELSSNSDSSWEGIGFILGGSSQVNSMMKLLEDHPKAAVGTFDLTEVMFEPFTDGRLKFGIDQQPLLQGVLPVYLLTYAAYTQQALTNDVIETGPRFVDAKPTPDEEQCEATFFAICSILPVENMNLIHPGLLIVGYVLVGTTVVTAYLCICFVVYYREKSVLVSISQPPFLITLCIGCVISIASIIPMGVQTTYRFEKDLSTGDLTDVVNSQVEITDAACMMVPWFYSLGFVMVFSSLFGKIWRVQMIYRAGETFRRKKITFMDIAPYCAIMFAIVLTLLISWQVAAPFKWEREVISSDNDGFALESTGMCTSDGGWFFWLVILCFHVFCLFYALVLCFQTKHIQDDLSESSNTFLAVVCIFQINVLAMPIAAMVRDDTQVFYFVRTCAVFLQNYSVLCLMFLPKMYRIATKNDMPDLTAGGRRSTRGSSLRVSFADEMGGSSRNFQQNGSGRFSVGTPNDSKLPPPSILLNGSTKDKDTTKISAVTFVEDFQEEKAPDQRKCNRCPHCFRAYEDTSVNDIICNSESEPVASVDEEMGASDTTDMLGKISSGTPSAESAEADYNPIETEDTTLSGNDGEEEEGGAKSTYADPSLIGGEDVSLPIHDRDGTFTSVPAKESVEKDEAPDHDVEEATAETVATRTEDVADSQVLAEQSQGESHTEPLQEEQPSTAQSTSSEQK